MTALSRRTPIAAHRPTKGGIIARLWQLVALRRQRRLLVRLDDHALRDIGLSRAQAQNEAARPLWDVPSHWRG